MVPGPRAPIGALATLGHGLGLEQGVGVFLGPAGQHADDTHEARAQLGQPVVAGVAVDQPIAFQPVERLREHLLRDPADALEQLGVTARPLAQSHYHDDRP